MALPSTTSIILRQRAGRRDWEVICAETAPPRLP